MKDKTAPRLAFNHTVVRQKILLVPLLLSILLGANVQSTTAADRVFQVLGACGQADVQFEGNRKRGRSRLISYQPNGDAGFVLDGLEGVRVSALQNILVGFEPPAAGSSTFIMRVKTQANKVQQFLIGDDSSTNLPNLETDPISGAPQSLSVSIQSADLVGGKSKLHPDDVIAKLSFLFSTNKKNTTVEQHVELVVYSFQPVSLLLDPVTCNLK